MVALLLAGASSAAHVTVGNVVGLLALVGAASLPCSTVSSRECGTSRVAWGRASPRTVAQHLLYLWLAPSCVVQAGPWVALGVLRGRLQSW